MVGCRYTYNGYKIVISKYLDGWMVAVKSDDNRYYARFSLDFCSALGLSQHIAQRMARQN